MEITLWTIQPAQAWEEAAQKGILKADGRRVWNNSRPAYRWLMSQMSQRITGYKPNQYPLWAWGEKPDLRRAGHLPAGTPAVRIALQIDPDTGLKSDFLTWGMVLSREYLAMNEADERWYSKLLREQGLPKYPRLEQLTPPVRVVVEQSWQRIFDLPAHNPDPEWWDIDGPQQYTFGPIGLDQVLSVQHFVSR